MSTFEKAFLSERTQGVDLASKSFNGVAAEGQLVPVIVKATTDFKTNLAPAAVSFTPPAKAGIYRVTCYLDVTTGTTVTFKNKLTYKDPAGSAITDHPIWQLEGSATLVTEPTANTADRFVMGPYLFSTDNSSTPITVVDDSGTYTTCIYRYNVVLEMLA